MAIFKTNCILAMVNLVKTLEQVLNRSGGYFTRIKRSSSPRHSGDVPAFRNALDSINTSLVESIRLEPFYDVLLHLRKAVSSSSRRFGESDVCMVVAESVYKISERRRPIS